MQFHAGDRINHYTLLEPLGEGGQGSVWKVVDPRDGGVVRALKLVSLAEAGRSAFDRVLREARILAGAAHPALVTCHGFFEESREGLVGLVMDLVPGRSLADILDTQRLNRGQSLALLVQIADALAYVHGAGLLHRDLKPENLVLTDGFWEDATRPGAVKLVDFGIAASAHKPTQLTRPGSVIGTLPYLAPELVDPATWGRAEGPQRDIFAFGVLASRLLLDKHPTGLGFSAEIIDYARAYKAAEAGRIAWPPPGLDGRSGAAVGACLALRPAARPANGAELVELLRTGATSNREPWSGSSGPTSPHRAPVVETLVDAKTAPMRTPPPGAVKTLVAAPLPPARPSAPAPSRNKLWAVFLVFAGAMGGAATYALLRESPWSQPTASVPTATPPPPPPESAAPLAPIAPCRRDSPGFKASATRFDCPICTGEPGPLPSFHGQLRFYGVSGPSPMPRPDLGKKICAQVTGGPAVCVPFSKLPDSAGAADRLPVTTDDLDNGRVYFSIRDADGIVAKGFGHRKSGKKSFLETALCAGFVLYLDDPAVTITVFLDER